MNSFTPSAPLWVEGTSGPDQIGWFFVHGSLNCWMVDPRYTLTQLMVDSDHNFHKWDAERAEFVQIPSPLHELKVRAEALNRMIEKIDLHESVAGKIKPRIWPLVFIKNKMQVAAPATFDLSRFTTRQAMIARMQADIRSTHPEGVTPLETFVSFTAQELFMFDLYEMSKAIEPTKPIMKYDGFVGTPVAIQVNRDGFEPMETTPDEDE